MVPNLYLSPTMEFGMPRDQISLLLKPLPRLSDLKDYSNHIMNKNLKEYHVILRRDGFTFILSKSLKIEAPLGTYVDQLLLCNDDIFKNISICFSREGMGLVTPSLKL